VERICTDIAFLKDGKIAVQGKLNEVRGQNRTEEYILETICEEDTKKMLGRFPHMIQKGQTQISFTGSEEILFQVLSFLTEQKIPVLKVERQEPTLESMFMEVLEG
jgi:ABC-2 type transport system ATP-binding protein